MSNHRTQTQTDDAENVDDVNKNTTEDWENFAHGISVDHSIKVDMDTFYKLLPIKSNTEIMLKYLFELVINFSAREREEMSDEVLIEVLYALCWHLPLHPWHKIDVSDGAIKIIFSASFYIVVKCDVSHIQLTWILPSICCSHVQRILIPKPDRVVDREISDALKWLRKEGERKRKKAFGKRKKRLPSVDYSKSSFFTSSHSPIKLMSLLFLREIGEIRVNHILIENAMRCSFAYDIYNYIELGPRALI